MAEAPTTEEAASVSKAEPPDHKLDLKNHHTQVVIAISGIAVLLLTYLMFKRSSSSSASTTSSTTSSTTLSTQLAGISSQLTTLHHVVVGSMAATGAGGTPQSQVTVPAPSLPPAAPNHVTLTTGQTGHGATITAAPGPAPGTGVSQITIKGVTYDVLGMANNVQYNVGGGAPVFFGNANTIQQGPTAESKAKADGGYAYTPATYTDQVHKAAHPGPAGG